jgi:hypothetical protein
MLQQLETSIKLQTGFGFLHWSLSIFPGLSICMESLIPTSLFHYINDSFQETIRQHQFHNTFPRGCRYPATFWIASSQSTHSGYWVTIWLQSSDFLTGVQPKYSLLQLSHYLTAVQPLFDWRPAISLTIAAKWLFDCCPAIFWLAPSETTHSAYWMILQRLFEWSPAKVLTLKNILGIL